MKINMNNQLTKCTLCPRKCGTDRTKQPGFCGGKSLPKIARAALHYWEEPIISGENGSGTIFFSGCSLQCCFCQNHPISADNFGEEVSIDRLAEIFLELQEQGANNINLVTGGHYVPQISAALTLAKPKLKIPVVYNSSGYELVETLKMLDGKIDIYLPDLKYMDDSRAIRYSNAPHYFEIASASILEMYRQVGPAILDDTSILQKGLVIRHLVMPDGLEDSTNILHWIQNNLPCENIFVSVMSQYTPFGRSSEYPEINRRLSQQEYDQILDVLDSLDIEQGFIQELSSAKEEYTPNFSLQGVKSPYLESKKPD